MIATVATFSLDQARKHFHAILLARLTGTKAEEFVFPARRRAWIGFDSGESQPDASPLHFCAEEPSLVVRCADWDRDSKTRGFVSVSCELEPTIAHARAIVGFVLGLHRATEEYSLAVHCHAGLFRSGAVAEWVRVDLGVPEHASSNRLVDVITGEEWSGDRTYNETLLRLLREAHAEVTR